ncbi:uncharacterized protein LOC107785255 [Nicotiana tabacum]|uniref:uncharacterized protein LOC107785255 n=1 Tax=Nicotiana tabacum TaxID=4097 RepID=UPI003F4E97ED
MRFQHETPTSCCGEESVRLVNTEVSIQLYELLVDESDEAKEFHRNIRAYNSIFAFTSFGVRLDKELASSRKGVYTFKAQDGNNPNVPFDREIIVHEHSGNKYRVKHYYGCYGPLQYPLLFPNGEVGWHQGMHKYKSKRGASTSEVANVSQNVPTYTSANEVFHKEEQGVRRKSKSCVSSREYYCYKFQIRKGEKTILLLCGRLLQQFVIDMYIKLETTSLEFFRLEKALLIREILQGIVDSIMAAEYRGDKVGQRVILPASFIGGPRDMRRRYMDAMALVQHFGKPDLFITRICNPDWAEIKENLCEGQLAEDRPDLVTRVFRAKLQDLKDRIFKKKIFGPVAAHVFVVEFQKRGLPHIHLLIILEQGYKIISADQYDKFISTELPDEEEYPLLHDLVVKHMMHGPCGKHHPTNSCMKDGQCMNHYPRPFSNKSIQGKDGYPIYKRRNDGKTVNVRGMRMNTQWVVPYNPYLLTRYNCHINVESCSGVKAIKYLYKYIYKYKGHDRYDVYVESDDGEKVVDEIQNFQDARWMSPPEALWRIYEFNLSEIKPPVINLQLHLPDRQTTNPREGERYYLRLLLNHVRGPLSFNDLLTVNGRECETFKEAAKKRGLLESDNSISECLREAVLFKKPSALRNLFATILVHCNPTDIKKLWKIYYEDMSEDFRKIHDNSPVAQLQCTLKSINYFLESMGKKIDKYDLPKLDHRRDNGTEKTFLYRALIANLISRGMIALATTTSGVASAILPGGRTAHSRFDIPLQTTDTTITDMSKQSGGATLIRKSKLIIWDEATMTNRQTIES